MVVVGLNVLIAVGCLWGAWKVWRMKRSLARAADALIAAEQVTHRVLHRAPAAIMGGQLGSRELRHYYRQLKPQLRQAQQVLALIGMGQVLWQRRSPFKRHARLMRKKKLEPWYKFI